VGRLPLIKENMVIFPTLFCVDNLVCTATKNPLLNCRIGSHHRYRYTAPQVKLFTPTPLLFNFNCTQKIIQEGEKHKPFRGKKLEALIAFTLN
jgi:hypothetical protein